MAVCAPKRSFANGEGGAEAGSKFKRQCKSTQKQSRGLMHKVNGKTGVLRPYAFAPVDESVVGYKPLNARCCVSIFVVSAHICIDCSLDEVCEHGKIQRGHDFAATVLQVYHESYSSYVAEPASSSLVSVESMKAPKRL